MSTPLSSEAMDERGWQPIETAPKSGNFMVWRRYEDGVVTVRRFDHPHQPNSVMHAPTGRYWTADWWMPLPPPPAR